MSEPADIGAARLAPMLAVRGGKAALGFYADAFGASAVIHAEDPAGEIVAELSLGEARFWIADESPAHGNPSPASLGGATTRFILEVADPDAVVARAIAAGAAQVWPVGEAHGWRLGRIEDPFGHHWEIGRRLTR